MVKNALAAKVGVSINASVPLRRGFLEECMETMAVILFQNAMPLLPGNE
jgi:hypothetical protein